MDVCSCDFSSPKHLVSINKGYVFLKDNMSSKIDHAELFPCIPGCFSV